MQSKLIFTSSITGHHLEFVHHAYEEACKDRENTYVFALPQEFYEVKELFEWGEAENVQIVTFDATSTKGVGLGKHLIAEAQIIRNLVKSYQITEVIMVVLMRSIPFLPFFLPRGVKISGVLYYIYIYEWKRMRWSLKLGNALKYVMMTKFGCYDRLLVLNDSSATNVLNRVWHTDRFAMLPDPFMPIPTEDIRDLREELHIPANKKIILHAGTLTGRKGTMDVLRMIAQTDEGVLAGCCFIFAGKLYDGIKERFLKEVEVQSKRAQIIVRDEFMEYGTLASMIHTADWVLQPYHETNQSSGIIGYCAQLGTPVIVPDNGLIGKLVKRNQIGSTLSSFDSVNQIMTLPTENTDKYCITHSRTAFARQLLAL